MEKELQALVSMTDGFESCGKPRDDALAAVLPVEAQITARAPSSTALATATTMPRSLKLPVGFSISSLRWSSSPRRSESRGAGTSGVEPSPSESAGREATLILRSGR